ncbi:MAG: ComEA family DNA-binding protein [Candidatus Cryptobacteroides sp.]
MRHSALLRIEANRDHPDTVFVYMPISSPPSEPAAPKASASPDLRLEDSAASPKTRRADAEHSPMVKAQRERTRRVESFPFDPNTVSLEDLQRLGFSEKQAQSIINYRDKGGRFHRAEDFARSYVVSDSIYSRLKAYIRIPKLDINLADSAAFDALPGIGPYYASQMVKYRDRLGGYACPEQLLELYKFGEERLEAIADLIDCPQPHYFPLWTADEAELAAHPAIRRHDTARAILLYKKNSAPEKWTVKALSEAGILSEEQALMLTRCTCAAESR